MLDVMSEGTSACMSANTSATKGWSLKRGPYRKFKEYYCFCTGHAGNTKKILVFSIARILMTMMIDIYISYKE